MKKNSKKLNKSVPKELFNQKENDFTKSMKMYNIFGKTKYLKFISKFDKDDCDSMTKISQKVYNIQPPTKKEFSIMKFISDNHDQSPSPNESSSPQNKFSISLKSKRSPHSPSHIRVKSQRKETSNKSVVLTPMARDSKYSTTFTNFVRQSNKQVTTKSEQAFNKVCNDVFNKSQDVFKANHKKQEHNNKSLHNIFNKNLSDQNYRYNDDDINEIRETEMNKYVHNRDFVYGRIRGHSLQNNRKLFVFAQNLENEHI